MRVFVSSPRVGQEGSATDELIRRLRDRGAEVEHSPPDRSSVPSSDPRLAAWDGWYAGGCVATAASADVFVAVVDDWYTCSTWMGIELDAAQSAGQSRALRLCWFEDATTGGASHLAECWATALGNRLPLDLQAAVETILVVDGTGTLSSAAT